MCEKPDWSSHEIEGTGVFRKDNLPEATAYYFPIMATRCVCGEGYAVRMKNIYPDRFVFAERIR